MASISMKSVLLGSAAGILATAAAQAADLPVMKAAAVQYVKVCSAYGTGFFEIPGTDSCIKIWAHKLAVDVNVTPAKNAYIISQDSKTATYTATYWPAGGEDLFGIQLTARPGVDIRSPTAYGTVRGVIVSEMKNKYGQLAGTPPGGSGSTSISCYRCYLEWAGFTLGTTSSAWPYLNEDDIYGSMIDAKNSNFIAQYSFKAAGGLSGSIGFEDPLKHFAKGGYSTNQAGLAPSVNSPLGIAVNNGPYRWWDVVGALNWEQDWGNIALKGALHQISLIATNTAFTPACPAPAPLTCTAERPTLTSSGYALLAGVTFKLPSLGSKDQILFQFIYGNGALDYVGFSQTQITGAQGDVQSWVGGLMRDDRDAIAISNGDGTFRIEKETAWSGTAQLKHYWAPDLRSNLMVNYAEVTPGTVTQNTDWTLGGLGKANRTSVGANIIWGNASKNSELSLEVMYVQARQTLPGTNGAAPSALPAGISANNDNWNFHFAWEKKW